MLSKKCCNAMTVAAETKKNITISKPIISVKLQNKNCKTLLDTRADVNVALASLLNKMLINFQRPMPREGCVIKCANNSSMKILGDIHLPLSIGVQTKAVRFLVVNDLKPNLIIGVTGLKRMKVDIFMKNSYIKCMGIEIPFFESINSSSKNLSETL